MRNAEELKVCKFLFYLSSFNYPLYMPKPLLILSGEGCRPQNVFRIYFLMLVEVAKRQVFPERLVF